MNSEDVPRCVDCDCDLIVEDNLIKCGDVAEVRQRYDSENLHELFHEISVRYIFGFLWEIGMLYRKQILLVHDYM